jgi:hypothetical protein
MPIKLKHRDVLPREGQETVHILGLDIPLGGDLPFGAQIELLDLVQRNEDGKVGQFEFLMRLFCLYTRRLPKREQVEYAWLAQQHLDADEVTELTQGVVALLKPTLDAALESDEGNAGKPRRGKKTS